MRPTAPKSPKTPTNPTPGTSAVEVAVPRGAVPLSSAPASPSGPEIDWSTPPILVRPPTADVAFDPALPTFPPTPATPELEDEEEELLRVDLDTKPPV